MEIQIKSVTVYIREAQFEQFTLGRELTNLAWSLTPDTNQPQVQVQVSLDTYYIMLDATQRGS